MFHVSPESAIVSAIDNVLWPEDGVHVHLREFPLVQEQVYQAAQQAHAEAKKGESDVSTAIYDPHR